MSVIVQTNVPSTALFFSCSEERGIIVTESLENIDTSWPGKAFIFHSCKFHISESPTTEDHICCRVDGVHTVSVFSTKEGEQCRIRTFL